MSWQTKLACGFASGSSKAHCPKFHKTSNWNLKKKKKKHHIYKEKKKTFKNVNKAYKTFGIDLIFHNYKNNKKKCNP